MLPRNSRRFRGPLPWVVGLVATIAAAALVAGAVDTADLEQAWRALTRQPERAVLVLVAFGGAFALRALAWRGLVPGLSFGHALASIHVALGANHVLPLRMGEPLRVVSAARRAGIAFDTATASTITLRVADLLSLLLLGWWAAPGVVGDLVGAWIWPALGALGVSGIGGFGWLRAVARRRVGEVRLPSVAVVAATSAAWLLEAVLVWQSAAWAGIDLTPAEAMLVTATAVVAQVGAVAPGGFGTYEAAAVAGYVALGHPAGAGLVAALTAHGLKTAYSLLAGGVAIFVPAPGLLGRLRLPRQASSVCAYGVAHGGTQYAHTLGDGPVVLFMPAHDEEDAVADVVRRVPSEVCGRRVVTVVVDDGSSDATAARAAAAGAEVVSLPANRGLGAAVRVGLADAVARGAAAVAFCDADGEYAPEELERLVAPVLDGRADYVVGSRFAGGPRRMLPHRRLGNVVLTRLLGFVARRPISDGQTGYRAFSPEAAAAAEIVHDYNYAQVLTLDLLGKGFRYAEVPITYHFRTTGDSFVKLGRYLRKVVPAVHRELNPRAETESLSPR